MIPVTNASDLSAIVSQSQNKNSEELEKMGLDLKNLDAGTRDAKIKRVSIQFEQMMIDQLLKSAFKDQKEEGGGDEDDAPIMPFGPVNDFKIMLMSQHIADNGGLGYQQILEQKIKENYSIDDAKKEAQAQNQNESEISKSNKSNSKTPEPIPFDKGKLQRKMVRLLSDSPKENNDVTEPLEKKSSVTQLLQSLRVKPTHIPNSQSSTSNSETLMPQPEKTESVKTPETQPSKTQTLSGKRSLEIVHPVDPGKSDISSNFGWRPDPFTGRTKFHHGVDFEVPMNTPVKSVMEGEVIFSGWEKGYGNKVEIKHPDGKISVYGHNSTLSVKEGDTVQAGEVIALSGSTGRSTGPHLHFEIRNGHVALNPTKFLKQKNIVPNANVFAKKTEI